MSYSPSLVYLPSALQLDDVVAHLEAKCHPDMVSATSGGRIHLELDGAALLLFVDEDPVVVVEATELAETVPTQCASMLRASTKRIEIGLADPRVDPDDIYNQLLLVFDVLCALPGAVGLDPYDGEVYPSVVPGFAGET